MAHSRDCRYSPFFPNCNCGEIERRERLETLEAVLKAYSLRVDNGKLVPVMAPSLITSDAEIAEVFALAERLCDLGYEAQGGNADDPEERDEQQQTRERREATWFEELYCQIRDMADDWNREAIQRRADNRPERPWNEETCDPTSAIKLAGLGVLASVKDWDY